MNPADMLDYTFGLLDEPRRMAFERALSRDSALADQVSRLGAGVSRLVDDGDEIEPPLGLAGRTIALVQQRKQRPQFLDFAPTRVPFRWTDVAVAATVLLAGLLTLVGPVISSRANMHQASCADNLRKLGVGLVRYASSHGSFPFVPAGDPVGAYAVMLNETHDLTDPNALSCPCTSKAGHHAPLPDDYEKFRIKIRGNPDACREMIGDNFAYNTGYRGKMGVTPIPSTPPSVIPLASDAPPTDAEGKILEGNSRSHDRRGQNVLFSDGHVEFKKNRWISDSDRDLFLNAAYNPARGLHASDSSLAHSIMRARDN